MPKTAYCLTLLLSLVLNSSAILAQNLPQNLTCQDLIDTAAGKSSRSIDGGRTFVPIKRPQTNDQFDQALLTHDTQLCQRLTRGEITLDNFNTSHNDKLYQLQLDRDKAILERNKALAEQKTLENQATALENQQRALQHQQQSIVVQQKLLDAQRETTREVSRQAEITRQEQQRQQQQLLQQQQSNAWEQQRLQQQSNAWQQQQLLQQQSNAWQQQQVQQQQLNAIRQQQLAPRSVNCYGGGNWIQCN
jgi:hypothetical protein